MSHPSPARDALRPHQPLVNYYAAETERAGFVRTLFDATAGDYDRINTIFSMGSGRWYRRRCLRDAGMRAGAVVLDVAVGTGLVAREAGRLVGPAGLVIGLDVSAGMLARARATGLPLVQGRAEQLPIADAAVDFVSMGYALRHASDLALLFAEFRRVLRPGGILLMLEIGPPRHAVARLAMRLYLGRVVPWLSFLLTGHGSAAQLMRYYHDTIEACVDRETILSALAEAGLAEVDCTETLGIFRSYRAVRAAG